MPLSHRDEQPPYQWLRGVIQRISRSSVSGLIIFVRRLRLRDLIASCRSGAAPSLLAAVMTNAH